MSAPVAIDVYLGLGSRYSYLAATQIARIEAEYDCRFHWKPIASGMLMDRRGANPFKAQPASGQYETRYRDYDAQCWASYYGVPLKQPGDLPHDSTLPARACLAAAEQNALEASCRCLMQMVFVDRQLIDTASLRSMADRLGLDAGAFLVALDSDRIAARHDHLIAEAKARAAFGVPAFFLGDRMFWGNDRLVLLEAALRGTAMPVFR